MSTAQLTTPPPAWLAQAEAAEYLGITDRTLRRWVASGQLPAYRLGVRLLRFKQSDLDALLQPVPTAGRPLTAPAAAGRSR